MTEVRHEPRWHYPSAHPAGGTAVLRVFTSRDGAPVAVVTQRHDERGTSVVNAAEHIHQQLRRELGQDVVHIQHLPRSSWWPGELSRVTLVEGDDALGRPAWEEIGRAALEALLGQPLPALDPVRDLGGEASRPTYDPLLQPLVDRSCTAEPDCQGVQLAAGSPCIAHTGDAAVVEGVLAGLRDGGDLWFGAGVRFEGPLLQRVVEALPRGARGEPVVRCAGFARAHFVDGAYFDGATFMGPADFRGATFDVGGHFTSAVFEGAVDFSAAHFRGAAALSSTFRGDAVLRQASFDIDVVFVGARFDRLADLTGVAVAGTAHFGDLHEHAGAVFAGHARFDRAEFARVAVLAWTTFAGPASFAGLTAQEATFTGARMGSVRELGPITVSDVLDLSGVTFEATVAITATAARVDARGLRLLGGGHLALRGRVDLSRSLLLGHVAVDGGHGPGRSGAGAASSADHTPLTAITSLEECSLEHLHLARVALTHCRFLGARGLEGVRLGDGVQFDEVVRSGARRYRTRRRVLEDESAWRRRARRRTWASNRTPHDEDEADDVPPRPAARAIASVYRALRKAGEDSKDDPGSWDLYYGEMEMRRHGATSGTERAVLTLYWLTSGYGLRASRALLSLLACLLVGAAVLLASGSVPTVAVPAPARGTGLGGRFAAALLDASVRDWATALTHAAESSTAVGRGPEQLTTLTGRWCQIALKLLGPALLGLALLSLRSRVKR